MVNVKIPWYNGNGLLNFKNYFVVYEFIENAVIQMTFNGITEIRRYFAIDAKYKYLLH